MRKPSDIRLFRLWINKKSLRIWKFINLWKSSQNQLKLKCRLESDDNLNFRKIFARKSSRIKIISSITLKIRLHQCWPNNASVKQAICNWYGNGSLIDQHRKNHPKSKLTIKVFWPLAASSDYKNTSGKLLDRAAVTSSSSATTQNKLLMKFQLLCIKNCLLNFEIHAW